MRVLQVCLLLYSVAAELNNQLKFFETLNHVDVNVRRKRSADGHGSSTHDVSFTAFGKKFNMILSPGTPVTTSDFKAKLVYRDGQTVPLYINSNNFFTGHLSEDEDIKVDALTEDDLWTANIYASDDIYTLEPSWRHLPQSNNHSMIVYRHSDIKWDNIFPDLNQTSNDRQKFCQGLHPEDDGVPDSHPEWDSQAENNETNEDKGAARFRRAVPDQNTCHILAVADYTFFSGPGGGYPHKTANYIIQTMQRVNRIYRNTIWDSELGLTGLGLQIKELRIHPEVTDSSKYHSNGRHYNMYDGSTQWPYEELLRQFGEDNDLGKFCLAHLFTHRRFAGGVLGLAYIASPRKFANGGICSSKSANMMAYNTGFSSSMNTKGHNLLTQEAMLVTAHEFGHNWGAEHDAETSECAPSGFNNGRFIMYPYAVSGYDENNDNFSPCSKRYITEVLSTRSDICFKAEENLDDSLSSNVPLCGNGIIDKDEDCDGGGMGLSGQDACCSSTCKFIGNASCSATNYECCKGCRLAPQDTPCRGESREMCQQEAFCTGLSLDCPPSKPLKNDTPCIDEGKCFSGLCLDYCAYAGQLMKTPLRPCRCENIANSCLRCCKSSDEVCKPLNSSNQDRFLQDGRPCKYGYCESGQCQKISANMVQRLFDFIERLDSSTFVAFMRSNIVGTVIIFSLVVWIPLSWAVSCIDKRNERIALEKSKEEATLSQSLKVAGFADHLKDYKVRESKFRHTGRARNLRPLEEEGAPYNYNYPTEEKKYKFYTPAENSLHETAI